jgi:signal transduction histidine kinase
VYRIGAEALTNAVRHGEASRIDVVLSRNGSTATIEVRDDGRGLPPIRRPGSNGLRSMRARAETIGAALSIGPGGDGRGTTVQLTLTTDTGEPRPKS